MNLRCLVAFAILMGSLVVPQFITAAVPTIPGVTRQDIKSIPITERPNRPGHFYGNTVRRANNRKGG